ncbi:MAG: glycosyltransferase family 4 protein [Candidatus Omnitrophica bacterium]|nr:glycosyltransferase family 4 protein [Candidatus Omnitrophota bacterium]MDD5429307.1 glycosyltransferase family 4 protein [Candidatus Omnitrophota bacterium]
MRIAFSYAGKIAGLGQSYIVNKTVMASVIIKSLYQLFARDFNVDLAEKAKEAVKIKSINEFELAHGLLARLLKRLGLTYYLSNISYDNKVAKRVKPCDIFHAFASQSTKSILQAKKLGARVIADNPNTHPENIRNILAEEYRIWKVPYLAYSKIAVGRRVRALEAADIILVLSKLSFQSFIDRGYSKEKLRRVPYGVDTELFRPRVRNDDKFRVLFVGQICLRKGFQYLLEAWRMLKLKNVELVLAGNINPDALYALCKYERKIDFKILGPFYRMEDIAKVYNQVSVAVFPSIEEGFGMVVTEALASGIPVVVSENVGAKDLINDGENGFIVPIRDAKAIKDSIAYLYEDEKKRKDMSRKARVKAESQTWQRYQDKLIGIYRELGQ